MQVVYSETIKGAGLIIGGAYASEYAGSSSVNYGVVDDAEAL